MPMKDSYNETDPQVPAIRLMATSLDCTNVTPLVYPLITMIHQGGNRASINYRLFIQTTGYVTFSVVATANKATTRWSVWLAGATAGPDSTGLAACDFSVHVSSSHNRRARNHLLDL